MHVVDVDREQDNVFLEEVHLQSQPVPCSAHLLRPALESSLFISFFAELLVEETAKVMHLALRSFAVERLVCPLLQHCSIKVDHFVVEPLARFESPQIRCFDLLSQTLCAEGWVLQSRAHLHCVSNDSSFLMTLTYFSFSFGSSAGIQLRRDFSDFSILSSSSLVCRSRSATSGRGCLAVSLSISLRAAYLAASFAIARLELTNVCELEAD